MNIGTLIRLKEIQAAPWGSGPGPQGADWTETQYGAQPIPTFRPPSLKNAKPVKTATPATGWHKKDSKKKKKRARKDLKNIMKWTLRQTGRPTIAEGARQSDLSPYPSYLV